MRKPISVLKKVKPVLKRAKRETKWEVPQKGYSMYINGGIACSAKAKRMLALYPNIPQGVFNAFLKIRESRGLFSKSGVALLENLPYSEGQIGTGFFKLHLGKRHFFLKVIENKKIKPKFSPTHDLAVSQYVALLRAKKRLKGSVFEKSFDVVSPQFAFVSGKYSFLVTDFVDCQRVEDILKTESPLAKEVSASLTTFSAGIGFLTRRGFSDLGSHNAFYSPKEKKFIFFDLRYHYK